MGRIHIVTVKCVKHSIEIHLAQVLFDCAFSRPGQSQMLLYKHLSDSFIHSFNK